MMSATIKVGIIGAGRMGITHHAIINSHPDVEVTAIADPSSVMTVLLEKYVKVRTYKDSASLLENEQVDALLVCTPPTLNYDVLILAQRKGVHAFVEKPFLLSAEKASELARLYDGSGLVNQVGYVNRFNDSFVRVKRLVEEDALGKPIRFRSEMYSSTIIRPLDEKGWRSTRENGGGVVYEMASHSIDLINYLFGRPDKIVGTRLSRVFSKSVEDIVSSTFAYNNGLVGSLYVNWSDESFRKPTNKIEIFGQKGKILADQHGLRIFLSHASDRLGFKKGWNNLYITDVFTSVPFYVRGLEFTAQLYHFIDTIKSGAQRATRCSFSDGATTLSLIEELFHDCAIIENGIQ
jgi:predicted dehydrogenase